jgi:DNA-directed RNA polymerase sigma subunit (sigma70/sigma32)
MNETIKNMKAILTGMADKLTERERQVLEQRFGLVDGYSRTFEEVSRQFKTTTARNGAKLRWFWDENSSRKGAKPQR